MRGGRVAALAGACCLALAACGTATAQTSHTADTSPPAASARIASKAATPTPTPTPSIGEGEGQITVLGYRGYVEYGGTDSRANWVAAFERESGCRVTTLDQVRTPAELAQRYAEKSYDVVSASPELAGLLIGQGKVRQIDTALVPGFHEMPKRLRSLPAYTRDGKTYGVPFLWSADQVLYDEGGPKDWRGLFTAGGATALRDDPLTIAAAALALGVQDPYQLTREQLDRAVALLAERDGDERSYFLDSLDVIEGFATGDLAAAQATPYDLQLLRAAGRQVRAVTGGRMPGRADAWMISAEAAHPNCAYRWLAWMSSTDVQRQAAAWTGLAPADPDACNGRAGRVCAAFHVGEDAWLDRVSFAVRPSGDCGGQDGECTDYTEWESRWRTLVD